DGAPAIACVVGGNPVDTSGAGIERVVEDRHVDAGTRRRVERTAGGGRVVPHADIAEVDQGPSQCLVVAVVRHTVTVGIGRIRQDVVELPGGPRRDSTEVLAGGESQAAAL